MAHLNANFRDVLKAMRGELAKETRRMESSMDARLARALQASAALVKVRVLMACNVLFTLVCPQLGGQTQRLAACLTRALHASATLFKKRRVSI